MLRPVLYQKMHLSMLLQRHNEQIAQDEEKPSQVKYEWLIDREIIPALEIHFEKI